jgi:hypothetical protein
MRRIPAALAFFWTTGSALAQSFNIDFGDSDSVPAPAYAAAGRAGTWNNFGVLPGWQRFPLVDILGNSTAASIYNYGATQILTADNLGTSGNDEALIDDMFLSFNNPVDACIWIENVAGGTYEVLTYAITPNDPARMCRVRVDFGNPGPVMIGGTWPGQHQQGVTYAQHTVSIAPGGTIGLHSGLYNGFIQSGINGIQVRRVIDCPGDVNDDDRCDLTDLATLLAHFGTTSGATQADGDLDGDGDVELSDLATLLANFGTTCQ